MFRILFVVALCALTLAGCATQSHQQITALKRTEVQQPRILLMPLNVELSEMSAAGLLEPKAEWTGAAQKHIVTALRAEKAKRSIQMLEFEEDKAPADQRDDLLQLTKLHGAVGQSIMAHQYVEPLALPTKQGKFEWSLGPSTRALKDVYGADYALFVFVRDSYASAGRAAVIVLGAILGVGIPGGAQVGFASLVELETGNVVWFNRLARPSGDLRTEAAAQETVQTLIAGLPQ
ncbi:MAG TPA: hypothetical protein VHM01_23370 [Alphaproteobacteria bacterium]|nr:hypothetical protein [Alphaproteobacteria bacterium]